MADDVVRVGELAPEGACRDAIHVPVAPVVAGAYLWPGAHVALDAAGGAFPAGRLGMPDLGPAVGVVDPFLTRSVHRGERFWLFLYPGTVTGLRHAWTHPAFKVKGGAP